MEKLQGILAAPVTPMGRDQTVDVGALGVLLDFLIKGEIHGGVARATAFLRDQIFREPPPKEMWGG